uniref:Uncharacterized protein n=1 Tax=Sciurus vulgaris TaxID=55149 RepID=A0A8D2CQH6_SCIVU
ASPTGETHLTISCQAAIAWVENSPLSIEEANVEPPKAGEVSVKVNSNLLAFIAKVNPIRINSLIKLRL